MGPLRGRALGYLAAALGALGLVPAAPNRAVAQQNLGFEAGELGEWPQGWSWFGADEPATGVQAAVVAAPAVDGARSLQIAQTGSGTFTRIAQRVPAAALSGAAGTVNRVRLRAAVRGQAGAPRPELWLRIAGAKGALYVDSRGDSREVDSRGDSREPGDESANAPSAEGAGWIREELELALPADAEEIAFGALVRGAATVWLDDFSIEVIPSRGLPAPSPAALRYVDEALAIMQEHSVNRARLDWPNLRAATLTHARGAADSAGTQLALRYAIYELGDRHSYLLGPLAAEVLRRAPVANARTGRAPVEPSAELLDGRLGYVSVPSVVGGSAQSQVEFAVRVQRLIKSLDTPSTCGWILDLRRNSGGNLWPMLAGVGPLLGDGEVGASVYPDGRRSAVWYRDGQAGFGDYTQLRVPEPHRLVSLAPVAVLIGPATASSAEVLTTAFRGRAAASSFGAPTRGLSAGNRTFPLRDGAALILTVAATSDRLGRTYLGPIEPEQPVRSRSATDAADAADAADAREASADPVRSTAADWLEAQEGCRAAPQAASSSGAD